MPELLKDANKWFYSLAYFLFCLQFKKMKIVKNKLYITTELTVRYRNVHSRQDSSVLL